MWWWHHYTNWKLLKTAHIHDRNIPGTVSYWKRTHHYSKAINFYNSYVNKQEVSIFHNGSVAEYREYTLRNLLSLYTEKNTGLTSKYSYLIRSGYSTFIYSVQNINMPWHIVYLQKWNFGWQFSLNQSLVWPIAMLQ